MKLPIYNLVSNKHEQFSMEPYLTILIFSLKHLKLALKFSNELKNRSIGVYIGNQKQMVISWSLKHKDIFDIFSGGALAKWSKFGVLEKPWILVIDGDNILLSTNALSVPQPFVRNILIRMKVPVEDSVHEEDSSEIENRLQELANLIKKNYEEINELRNTLNKKNQTIEEINDKLSALENRGKKFTPTIDLKSTCYFDSSQSSGRELDRSAKNEAVRSSFEFMKNFKSYKKSSKHHTQFRLKKRFFRSPLRNA